MKRLTEVDNKGNWRIAGVEWGNVKGNLYGALCKLKDYEDTGLTPAEIMEGKLLTGWIPVEERLPDCTKGEETGPLLYQMRGTGTIEAGYYGCGGKIRNNYFRHYRDPGEGVDMEAVIAWQPLPEPFVPEN